MKYAVQKDPTLEKKKVRRQKTLKLKEKSFEVDSAVDPLYGFKAFADESFVDTYRKKWGVEK